MSEEAEKTEPDPSEPAEPEGYPGDPVDTAAGGSKDTDTLPNLGVRLVETAFRSTSRREAADADVFDAGMFRQVKNSWWLDRAFPGRVLPYFATAIGICTAVWIIGLGLRLASLGFEWGVAWDFVKNPQWQMQPLLLFVHFLCLRLFKGIYSRNFDRAFQHIDVTQEELRHDKRWFLGNRVNFIALAVAAPLIIYEFILFGSDEFFARLYGLDLATVHAAAEPFKRTAECWFVLALWTVEWMMFGYYCTLIAAGSLVLRGIMKRHKFVDSVDLVLTERQYRPLFNVTAQGGSLVFFYGIIHGGYALYTHAGWSDIMGLIVLFVLLAFSFSVTWSAVRGDLKVSVTAALDALEVSYRRARTRLGTMKDVPGIEDDIQRIQVQLKMQLALQQLDYLQDKYDSVGRRELLGLVFKMLAPVGSLLARVIRWGSLLAAVGLGGAAALGGKKAEAPQAQHATPEAGNQAPANGP